MTIRVLAPRVVAQWLPLVAVVVLLGFALGWTLAVAIGIGFAVLVVATVIGARRGARDHSRLPWVLFTGLLWAGIGSVAGGFGAAVLAGLFGLVIGLVSVIPLSHRTGEPYTDAEFARVLGLVVLVALVTLFVLLVIATVVKAR